MFEDDNDDDDAAIGDGRGPYDGGDLGTFYNPGQRDRDWSSRLLTNPHRAKQAPGAPGVEGQDEQQWGQQHVATFTTAGTGPTAVVVRQLVQATRPARVWGMQLGFTLANQGDLSGVKAPNASITVTFRVRLGLGTTYFLQYVQLFDTDLVTFAPDPSFPTRTEPAVASKQLTNLVAKQVVVDAVVKYDRILLASPANLQLLVQASVAPVFR